MAEALAQALETAPDHRHVRQTIDTSKFPDHLIVKRDAASYQKAAEDFIQLDAQRFTLKYPEIALPEAFMALQQGQHTSGPVAGGTLDAVRTRIHHDIANAKYPLIDHDKSFVMATAFARAHTHEQQCAVIRLYPELEEAFKVREALSPFDNIADDAVEKQIEKGRIPKFTPLIAEISARHGSATFQECEAPSR